MVSAFLDKKEQLIQEVARKPNCSSQRVGRTGTEKVSKKGT